MEVPGALPCDYRPPPIFLSSVWVYNYVFANSTMRWLWRQRKHLPEQGRRGPRWVPRRLTYRRKPRAESGPSDYGREIVLSRGVSPTASFLSNRATPLRSGLEDVQEPPKLEHKSPTSPDPSPPEDQKESVPQLKTSVLLRLSRACSGRISTVTPSTSEWSDLTYEPPLGDKPPVKIKRLPSKYQVVPVESSRLSTDAPVEEPSHRHRLRRPRKRTGIDGIRIPRRDQARILEQTLQLLFASEVLLFVEYMEIVIPVLYALIFGSEWALPNRNYSVVVRNMTSGDVTVQIETALGFALLELVSMLAVYWVMKKKYGVSAMDQLAFVLERYWMTLQGKLVGSFIVVLNAVTLHQGTDFSFLQEAYPFTILRNTST